MKNLIKKITKKLYQKIYILYIRYIKNYIRISSYPYVSGDTFRKYSQHVLDETSDLKVKDVKKGDIVFVKTDYLESFFIELMPKINNNFKLITHNSDINIDFEMKEFVKNKNIEWYAQNLNFVTNSEEKIFPLPIGLENKNYFNNGILSHFEVKEMEKVSKIMCSFNLNTNKERINVLNAIKDSENIYFLRFSNHKNYIRELSKCKFNICPEGNGLDTHRFWESLFVKTIPIVLQSNFIENFKKFEIPMLCLDSWQDLNKMNKVKLDEFYDSNKSKLYKNNFLEFDFWMDQIKNNNSMS